METIKTECGSCQGTGVFCGMAEPKGVGVVCLNCKGTGCREIKYTPFTGRKRRDDVSQVSLSRGSLLWSCGPCGKSVSYADFLAGRVPWHENRDAADKYFI